jgi:glycosyltransferase involved in cell wall biosynthesis
VAGEGPCIVAKFELSNFQFVVRVSILKSCASRLVVFRTTFGKYKMKIAIVHDWLEVYGGAERTLEQMLIAFPDADLYSLVDFLPSGEKEFLKGRTPRTTFIQNLPFARRHFRNYFPLFPFAVEQLSLSGYDVILSSSHAFAKGVITKPEQLHICYCYSPIRYAWDLQDTYLRERKILNGPTGLAARYFLHRIRMWDRLSSVGVDRFVGISKFICRRIARCYRRNAGLIYPPVDTDAFDLCEKKDDFYLAASRLVPYKRMPLIAEAFRRMPDRKLVIIGDGPDRKALLKAISGAPNIEYKYYQPASSFIDHMQRAKAFVFAAEEDFGIVMLEASACGTPVIAYRGGAASEIVNDISKASPTGVLFDQQTPEAIIDAVRRFEANECLIDPQVCRSQALRFGPTRFRAELIHAVETAYAKFIETGKSSVPAERHMDTDGKVDADQPNAVLRSVS